MGLLDSKIAKKVMGAVAKKTPEEQDKILSGLEAQLNQLSKKQRKKAEKLLGLFNKGQILRPNEDVDNKKLMLESE